MRAAFFVHHPYGRPIIGWAEEIQRLVRDDALAFYRTWYSPANAIVVISGDITAEELKPLAERTYGKVPARAVPLRNRVIEPVIDASAASCCMMPAPSSPSSSAPTSPPPITRATSR